MPGPLPCSAYGASVGVAEQSSHVGDAATALRQAPEMAEQARDGRLPCADRIGHKTLG